MPKSVESAEQDSRLEPNFFAVANAYVDEGIMAMLTGEEWKVLTAVIRVIMGYQDNRKTKEATVTVSRIQRITDLPRETTWKSLKGLLAFGLVELCDSTDPDGGGHRYRLQQRWEKVNTPALEARRELRREQGRVRTAKALSCAVAKADERRSVGRNDQAAFGGTERQRSVGRNDQAFRPTECLKENNNKIKIINKNTSCAHARDGGDGTPTVEVAIAACRGEVAAVEAKAEVAVATGIAEAEINSTFALEADLRNSPPSCAPPPLTPLKQNDAIEVSLKMAEFRDSVALVGRDEANPVKGSALPPAPQQGAITIAKQQGKLPPDLLVLFNQLRAWKIARDRHFNGQEAGALARLLRAGMDANLIIEVYEYQLASVKANGEPRWNTVNFSSVEREIYTYKLRKEGDLKAVTPPTISVKKETEYERRIRETRQALAVDNLPTEGGRNLDRNPYEERLRIAAERLQRSRDFNAALGAAPDRHTDRLLDAGLRVSGQKP